MYSIALFLHITSAIGLFAAIAIELGGLASVRRATTAAQLHEPLRLLGTLRRIAMPSMLLLLATGIHLAVVGRQHGAWMIVGLLGVVAMAAIGGGVIRGRVRAIARAAATLENGIPIGVQDRLRDPVLHMAAWLRTALGVGIVYDMTVKPMLVGAVVAIVVALMVGAAIAALLGMRQALPTGAPARS